MENSELESSHSRCFPPEIDIASLLLVIFINFPDIHDWCVEPYISRNLKEFDICQCERGIKISIPWSTRLCRLRCLAMNVSLSRTAVPRSIFKYHRFVFGSRWPSFCYALVVSSQSPDHYLRNHCLISVYISDSRRDTPPPRSQA